MTKATGGLRFRLLGDRSLATHMAAGDRFAFEEAFRRYRQPLYGFCVSILGNQEDSADALQNTMAKALKTLPGEEREILLKPWLFRVARNECIDLIRSRRQTDDIMERDPAATLGLDAELAGRERLRELLDDLEHLPEKQRSALVMRELNGLSFAEIAGAFETSPSAAKQVVYEARVSLQDAAKGRDMECESVRQAISGQDGRVLRGRVVRAHLRSCTSCQDFKRGIDTRGRDFKALMPPVPVAVVAAVIGMINGPGGGGGAGIAGLAGLKAALGGSAAKTAAVVAVTATVGAGAVGVVEKNRNANDRDRTSESRLPAALADPVAGAGGPAPAGLAGQDKQSIRLGARQDGSRPGNEAAGGQGRNGSPGEGQKPGVGGAVPAGVADDGPGNSENAPGGNGGSKGNGAVPSPGTGTKPAQLPEAAAQGQQRAEEAQAQGGPPANPGKSEAAPATENAAVPSTSGKKSK
ncbi:MAG: RNA polymerase sigma factor [Solirubrobacterales bacterium]